MAPKKGGGPERMKKVIEAMRNKEMGSYKDSRVFYWPHITLQRHVKAGRKAQVKQ